jgi:hypothetical protein
MAVPDLDRFVDDYHEALKEFFGGDPEPAKALYSHRGDASLANPFGPVAIGGEEASGALRLTSVLRPESGAWRVVHRHADPITTPRSAESLVQPASLSDS